MNRVIGTASLHLGDCLEVLRSMADNSVDSIVTDPPYGLNFMGKKWDYDVPSVEIWAECLRVIKPGGHLLAFAGTRTQHRMACRIEDAGFEIRDMIAWVYGSGFPKSLDVSKAISKRAGGDVVARKAIDFMRARREELGLSRIEFERLIFGRSDGNVRNWEDGISLPKPGLWVDIKLAMALDVTPFDADMERGDEEVGRDGGSFGYQKGGERWESERVLRAPATEAARQWQGWGTALKPALEPITMARKPLAGTVAENVLDHGAGAINVDGCRVELETDCRLLKGGTYGGNRGSDKGTSMFGTNTKGLGYQVPSANGRWPANLIHDGSSDVVAAFPDSNGSGPARKLNRSAKPEQQGWGMNTTASDVASLRDAGTGSAARFFYAAKASKRDRGDGNCHPTVKPTDLMAYLCRLVTPPGGVVLDPFMGSGSTGRAAGIEQFKFIGIEINPEYFEIACLRIDSATAQQGLEFA